MRDRKRIQDLVTDLQRSTAFEVQAIKEILTLELSARKDALVDCAGDDMLRIQGEARGIKSILTLLTRPPIVKPQGVDQ